MELCVYSTPAKIVTTEVKQRYMYVYTSPLYTHPKLTSHLFDKSHKQHILSRLYILPESLVLLQSFQDGRGLLAELERVKLHLQTGVELL